MCMSARFRAPALSLHTLKSLCPISTNTIHSLIKACTHPDHLKQVHPRLLTHGLHHHLPSLLSTTTVPKTVLSSAITVVVIALAAVWLFPNGVAWALSRSPRSIPGPTGIVVTLAGSAAHRALAGLTWALGATQLMAFFVGFTRFIVSSNPNTAKEILNSSAFADRLIKEFAYELLFHRAMGFASFDEYWRNLRRISATHLFSPKRIAAFGTHRQKIGQQMVEKMKALMGIEGVVEVKRVLHFRFLNNVMMRRRRRGVPRPISLHVSDARMEGKNDICLIELPFNTIL